MKTLPIISLFSGAGGIDYGFEAAGYRTAVAVEMDADCCATLRANRSWRLIDRDIFGVTSREILAAADLKRGEAAALVGGPPCQPFSKAGFWVSGQSERLRDSRADTLSAYLRVLEDTLPRTFLFENVEGFSYRGKDEGLRLLLDGIERINKRSRVRYATTVKVVNAASYGAPQLRKRLLVVGVRDGQPFEFPAPTHGESVGDMFPTTEPYRNAWDAIGDLDEPTIEDLKPGGQWAELLPSIPEGYNYLWYTKEMGNKAFFGWRTRYWSFLLKLAKNLPSWTIPAQPGPSIGPFHWNNRRLSMRELCRIQTFPDNVSIVGTRNAVQRQVGNAVPSLLAEVVARELRTQVFGQDRLPLRLLPPLRRPLPPPERRRPPSKKYVPGVHAAHPGTGRGPGALSRAKGASSRQVRGSRH